MNPKFRKWFTQGDAVEALCGFGGFRVPDVTYTDEHDVVLATGQLLEWASLGEERAAAEALYDAVVRLADRGFIGRSLLLLRSYLVLTREGSAALPVDTEALVIRLAAAVSCFAEQIASDESLRRLLLAVCEEVPALGAALGLPESAER